VLADEQAVGDRFEDADDPADRCGVERRDRQVGEDDGGGSGDNGGGDDDDGGDGGDDCADEDEDENPDECTEREDDLRAHQAQETAALVEHQASAHPDISITLLPEHFLQEQQELAAHQAQENQELDDDCGDG
jgi:hypothetical protein